MAILYRWTAWNLTPNGWQRSETADSPTDVTRNRPEDTLICLLTMQRVDTPDAKPLVSVQYRSPDNAAVTAAVEKYGGMPKD